MAIICPHYGTSAPTLIAHSLAGHMSIPYNMRGLKHIYKLEKLSHHITNNTIDFVCIQETWLSGSGPPKTVDTTAHSIPCKCTLFKHGPEKQEGCGSGGVAILLLPQGAKPITQAHQKIFMTKHQEMPPSFQ
eukprot:5677296-Ditylum_brightwellii.AAC.1